MLRRTLIAQMSSQQNEIVRRGIESLLEEIVLKQRGERKTDLDGAHISEVIEHKAYNPNGEIRGQLILAPEPGSVSLLLCGAGLLLRSFSRLTSVPPGFNAANLLVVNLPLSPQRYRDDASRSSVVDDMVA